MNHTFTHLHAHTEFSLLDSSNKIKSYIDRIKELGMRSAAITDHGVMYGVVDFYKYAKAAGIHPIIGCEVYVSPGKLTEKNSNETRYYHLVLLAENNTGYQNLIKLVSIGFIKGFYYRPRVDIDTLDKYHEGIIALSGCLAGEVAKKLVHENYEQACTAAEKYQKIFGHNNFFLELQDHGIKEQKMVNDSLLRMNKSLGIPLVATNDVHYTYKTDAESHDILLCIQTGKKLHDKNRLRYEGVEYYVKSQEEMNDIFSYAPEALKNTQLIADRCKVELTFGKYHLPKYDVPEGYSSSSYLKKLCLDGLKRRYPEEWDSLLPKLNYELNTIGQMGFTDYFLIVWDFINYAIKNGIPVGPGRGSAAGSLTSYCLDITNVDPIRYNLLFERFLNPDRITMPDIDIDFCMERRQEVIDYVNKKYGNDKVAQIITFGTLAAKGVIRDVGRALDIAPSKVDRIAKLIGNQPTLEEALLKVKNLNHEYKSDLTVKQLLDTAKKLEGLPRHISTHAAGVVISPEPVDQFVPLAVSKDGIVITQYIMTTIEELGILKMDFLGLRNLTVIQKCLKSINQNYGHDLIFNYDDKAVYNFIGTGQTDGIFQLESIGMKNFMKKLKPQSLEDIIAGISLYRPGPMDFIPSYICGRNDPDKIHYECLQLKPILQYTYGCIIYQEQVMQIVRELAGYGYGRADLLRRAMSKKKHKVMEDERHIFLYGDKDSSIPGCVKNGISEVVANRIFDSMIDFAKYAFNKSHAAAYAVVSYQTAYLKHHYPLEFFASLMTSMIGNADKISEYLLISRKMNIKILQPDINKSAVHFSVQDKAINYSFVAIKDIGEKFAIEIVSEREKGTFTNFENFIRRMSIKEGTNRTVIENLIKSGAFDCFGNTRKHLLETFPNLLEQTSYAKRSGMANQKTLFQIPSRSTATVLCKKDELSESALFAFEKEVLGTYLSGHPLDAYLGQWESTITTRSTDFFDSDSNNLQDNQRVTVGGIITSITIKATKSGSNMAYITLDDYFGGIEIVVFSRQYNKYKDLLTEESKLFCSGSVKVDEQKRKLIADTFTPLYVAPTELWVQFPDIQDYRVKYPLLLQIIKGHPGSNEISLYLKDSRQIKTLEDKIMISDILINKLIKICGVDNIRKK